MFSFRFGLNYKILFRGTKGLKVFKLLLGWFPSSKLLLHASHAALPK
jgi:hypothetical protein